VHYETTFKFLLPRFQSSRFTQRSSLQRAIHADFLADRTDVTVERMVPVVVRLSVCPYVVRNGCIVAKRCEIGSMFAIDH